MGVQELIQQKVALHTLEPRQSQSSTVVALSRERTLIALFDNQSRFHECNSLAWHICLLRGTYSSTWHRRYLDIRGYSNCHFLQSQSRWQLLTLQRLHHY